VRKQQILRVFFVLRVLLLILRAICILRAKRSTQNTKTTHNTQHIALKNDHDAVAISDTAASNATINLSASERITNTQGQCVD
jgi:hypothetical protein